MSSSSSGWTSAFDSIRAQVSNSLKEVFEEDAEPSDVAAQLLVARERAEGLESRVTRLEADLEASNARNVELAEQKEAVELQKELQCQQFRDLLREKEDELQLLARDQLQVPEVESAVEDVDRVEELERELRQLRESHQNELVALQEALSSKDVNEALESRNRDLELRCSQLMELNESPEERKRLEKELETALTRNHDLEQQVGEISQVSKNHEALLSDLRDQIDSLTTSGQEESRNFERLLEARQREVDELKASLTADNEVNVYKEQYENLLREYNQYLVDLETLQNKADDLEKLKTVFEAQVKELKEDAERNQNRLKGLEEKHNEAVKREVKAKMTVKSLEEQIGDLENRDETQNLRDRIERLEREKSELAVTSSSRISALEEEISQYRSEIADEEVKFEEQNCQLRAAEEELERYREEVSDSNAKFGAHSEQLDALQTELDSCIDRMSAEKLEQNQEIDRLTQEVEKLTLESANAKITWEEEREDLLRRLENSSTGRDCESEQNENRESLVKELTEAKNRINSLEKSSTENGRNWAEEKQTLQKQLEDADGFKMLTLEKDETIKSLSLQLEQVKSKLAEHEAKSKSSDRIDEAKDKWSEERETLLRELHEAKAQAASLEKVTLDSLAARKDWDDEKRALISQLEEANHSNSTLHIDFDAERRKLLEEVQSLERAKDESDKERQNLIRELQQLRGGDQADMTKEAVAKLSDLIRQKDEEISRLVAENANVETLAKEKQDLYSALTQKHQESLGYYAEIERLNAVIQSNKHEGEEEMKLKIRELERKCLLAESLQKAALTTTRRRRQRRRFLSEANEADEDTLCETDDDDVSMPFDKGVAKIEELSKKIEDRDRLILEKENHLLAAQKSLQEREEELTRSAEELRGMKRKTESLDLHQVDALRRIDEMKFEADNLHTENKRLSEENQGLASANGRLKVTLEEKDHDLEMAKANVSQLTVMLEEKSEDSESLQQERLKNVANVAELQSTIGALKRDRDQVALKLNDRERELTETRREVNNVIEKKKRLEAELERLRGHLVAVEDGYTQEALETEERERELRRKLLTAEESLREATAKLSHTSEESGLQLGSLQRQVQQLSEQRDQLLERLAKVTSDWRGQTTALDNLTMVLEGFQREKDNDVILAKKDYEDRLVQESEKREVLNAEIRRLEDKLEKANEGLAAATRISEQVDKKSQAISALRQEIKLRDELLKKAQNELNVASESTAGKVDKSLVKNLVVGYASADAPKKPEILKIVATVLDFNLEERQKTGLEGNHSSWLRGWTSPGASGGGSRDNTLDRSLAQAFVEFLEQESVPKKPPIKLPVAEMAEEKLLNISSLSSRPTTPQATSTPTRNSPGGSSNPLIMASESTALPTFAVNRASSAILKSVLHEDQG